jgi:hypothetical protein
MAAVAASLKGLDQGRGVMWQGLFYVGVGAVVVVSDVLEGCDGFEKIII